ncbi:uncharacterized protein PITG_07428 [Phytophthora infestans T30-4]|uniref:Uncharacterized protein n=1 Tax=Phytophthora infestans (strain T30-4) TaxID=403677 RepID=D0N8D9_PHYIT|nr:uncharacterized protein PITG_07428 [Phytophthora infestans T30-4]EEY53824.1 conserved hypothetical protein [Phytophthora infestans T30-4]|eukprot:XP_002904455.1 conserved hypothetical protein [Phytophthora infestans T30-4]
MARSSNYLDEKKGITGTRCVKEVTNSDSRIPVRSSAMHNAMDNMSRQSNGDIMVNMDNNNPSHTMETTKSSYFQRNTHIKKRNSLHSLGSWHIPSHGGS